MRPSNPIGFLAGFAQSLAARFAAFRRHGEPLHLALARARFDTRRWSAELLRQLEWRRFEELCVAYYEALGLKPRIGSAGADGAVDILLQAPGAEGASSIARCKAWDAYRVGTRAVRELRATMAAAGVGEAVLLTSGRFTQEAAGLARAENIALVDGAALLQKITALPPPQALALLELATRGDFLTPTCPSCALKMVSRQSTQGGRKFWGCRNYPRCKQTLTGSAHAPA